MKTGDKSAISVIILSSITAIYTIWYMHFGNPLQNSGALSKIGLEHKGLFVIWGILTFVSLALGIMIGYTKTLKTKIYIPLLAVSGAGMILTLVFDFDYNIRPDYDLHCAGSLAFSAVMGITIFLLFLLNYKKAKIFKIFTFISAAILLTDLVCLLIFKETGLIEALPIFAGYIMLGITNVRRDRIELTV